MEQSTFHKLRVALCGTVAIVLVVAVMFGVAWLPKFSGVPSDPPGERALCMNHLRQIGLALNQYHDAYGRYPPVYVTDEQGNPLYSWRVLILPFVEHLNLFESFNFKEPWDSPSNQPLSELSVALYRCPAESSQGNTTHYVAVSGANTPWQPGRQVTKDDLGPDLSKKILVVEVANAKIPWAKPEDLLLSEITAGVNASPGDGISSRHRREHLGNREFGAHVLFADGHVEFLGPASDWAKLSEMLTIASGTAEPKQPEP